MWLRLRVVPPAVCLFAVSVLLIGAGSYEDWLVKPSQCSLRTLTGIPCIGCGGTRAVKALASGKIIEAARFNPLVVVGVFSVAFWFIWTVGTSKMERYQRGWTSGKARITDRNTVKRWGIVITVLVMLNWIYLICYLPP